MAELKPKAPSFSGNQFAVNPYGSNYFGYHYDSENDEIPQSGEFKHKEATPGKGGNPDYSGRQYHELDSYGKSVSGPGSSSSTSVDTANANRGKER